jgi:hypothetical protein
LTAEIDTNDSTRAHFDLDLNGHYGSPALGQRDGATVRVDDTNAGEGRPVMHAPAEMRWQTSPTAALVEAAEAYFELPNLPRQRGVLYISDLKNSAGRHALDGGWRDGRVDLAFKRRKRSKTFLIGERKDLHHDYTRDISNRVNPIIRIAQACPE